jgi:hypothetical protein
MGAWGDIVPAETTKETTMLIRKPNIGALNALRDEWEDYIQQRFTGDNYDPCFSVGYMSIHYQGKDEPSTWKCHGAGFNIIVKENYVTCASVLIMVKFSQVKDGIKWTISRIDSHVKPHKAVCKVLHSGIARDYDILTNNPSPSLAKERMLKVAKVAVELAKAEQSLMHI